MHRVRCHSIDSNAQPRDRSQAAASADACEFIPSPIRGETGAEVPMLDDGKDKSLKRKHNELPATPILAVPNAGHLVEHVCM